MVKINPSTPSSVLIQPGEINRDSAILFKDGQTILAKVVHSSPEEVVLDVGGHTVQAKVEGTAPATGAVVLFGVRFVENGRIELQIQANAEEGLAANPDLFGSQLLVAALRERGFAVTSENLRLLNQILSDCQMKYNLSPEPKLAAFLMAHDLPVTSGTFLLSWLQQDGRVRDHLWNLLERSGLLDSQFMAKLGDSPETLLKFLDQLRAGNGGEFTETDGLLRAFKRDLLDNLVSSAATGFSFQESLQVQPRSQPQGVNVQTGELLSELLKLASQLKTEVAASGFLGMDRMAATVGGESVSGQISPQASGGPSDGMANLVLSETGQLKMETLAPESQSEMLTRQTLLTALREQGLTETPANLRLLEQIVSHFQIKYQLTLDPGLAALLMAQTIGREGNEASHPASDHAQALVKVLLGLGTAPSEVLEGETPSRPAENPLMSGPAPTLRDTPSQEAMTGRTGRPEVLQNAEKIMELLTNGMSWRTIRDQSATPDERWGALPFLIQDSQGLIRECVIHWQDQQASADRGEREQTVRLVIPTENLGDIALELKIGSAGTRIHFKVKSEAIKDYLLEREAELQQATGCEAQIRVETGDHGGTSRGALELWM